MNKRYILNYEQIGKRIARVRKLKKITQSQLAEEINISVNAVSKIEINYMQPSLQTIINIANSLNVDIIYLLFGEKNDKKSSDVLLIDLIENLTEGEKNFLMQVITSLKEIR